MNDREKRLAEIAEGMKAFNASKGYGPLPTRSTATDRAPVPPARSDDPKAARLEELKAAGRAVATRGYGRNMGD